MDAGPSGLLIVLQLVFIMAYALLSAAEAAAQQIGLSRMRYSDTGDAESAALLAQAEGLLATPSGIRLCMQLLAMFITGIALWCYAIPLAHHAVTAWGWTFINPGWLLALMTLLVFLLVLQVVALLAIILPRQLGAHKPRRTARLLFGWALAVNRLFRPLSRLTSALSLAILRLFGVDIMQPTLDITEDEIRMLVDVGEEKGAIEEAEREMIKNVFEFNNMTAAECMTHRTDVSAIWAQDSKEEIIELIDRTGLSRFPVYEEDLDHIIGTVSTREFLLNLQKEEPLPLSSIIREAHFVPETVRTDLLFRDMQLNKFHMAIVVDEYGGTSGLITMEDLLEEIVGNIYDEYDPQDQQEFEQLGEGRWRVAGTLDVETFNEESGQALPINEEYDTIGGLILSQMSSIPEDGSQPVVESDGLRFKVESVSGRRIEWVEVSKLDGV
ncbi:MAG: HlyC/CorC family transporter [Clostridiales bacterium]|nr:HlyC/CorC family transporter [Clostridiales bacterium]